MWGHCREWTLPRAGRGIAILIIIILLFYLEAHAQRAMMAYYDSGTPQVPKYRNWSGSGWSAEGSALSVGGTIQWVVLRAAPSRNAYILGTLDRGNNVNVQTWYGSGWGTNFQVTGGAETRNRRTLYVAFENSTGKGIIAYGENNDCPRYRTCTGNNCVLGSWSVEGEKNVSIMVYKEGVSAPIESINYYIRKEQPKGRKAGP